MAVQKKKVAKTTVTSGDPVVKEERLAEVKKEEVKAAASAEGSGEPREPVVVSDTITETIVIEEAVPQANQEKSAESPSSDPLSDFKEKMEQELSMPSDAPKKNYMWPILFIFIIAVILLAGVFIYKRGGINTDSKVNVVTLTPTPAVTAEPTKAIDLAQYEIQILNGGGIDGEASRQRVALTAEGFSISSVGNADNSDFTDTIIQAKETVEPAFLDKLSSVLEDTFTVGEVEVLSDDSSVPVIVILGTKK